MENFPPNNLRNNLIYMFWINSSILELMQKYPYNTLQCQDIQNSAKFENAFMLYFKGVFIKWYYDCN